MISKINDFFQKHVRVISIGIAIVTLITLALTLLPAGKVMPDKIWSYDRLGHLVVFGSWTFLIGYYRLLTKPKFLNLFTIFFIGVLFGTIVEVLQYIMPFGRTANFFDIAFDALGCFIAVFILHMLQKRSYKNPILDK